jgi:hypothetical protein
MPTLEVQLEKAEKALKELQADVDEKKKNDYKYRSAEFLTKDKGLVKERALLDKLKVAKANVERLKTKIYNKQRGGKTRRARGSKKTRRNL